MAEAHSHDSKKPSLWNDNMITGATVGGIIGGLLLPAIALIGGAGVGAITLPVAAIMAVTFFGSTLAGAFIAGNNEKRRREKEMEQKEFSKEFDVAHGLNANALNPYVITPEESKLLHERLSTRQHGSAVESLAARVPTHISHAIH